MDWTNIFLMIEIFIKVPFSWILNRGFSGEFDFINK